MPRKPQDVTDAELAILQVLWDRTSATVRELTEQLYPGASASEVATVQKLLGRLEAKRCVRRNRKVWPHVFEPMVERQELIGRRLQTTADELCDGELSPLLTHLVRSRRLSDEERETLRTLLNELDEQIGGANVSKE
ncbi:MAG: BlaI/MecI/CopY family transcriptional regulator [Planctomycetaceae bacterium]